MKWTGHKVLFLRVMETKALLIGIDVNVMGNNRRR